MEAGGARGPAQLMAPGPGPVLALHRVVEHAAAQRRLRPGGVELDGPLEDLVEGGEALRSGQKGGDVRALLVIDPRGDVDQGQALAPARDAGWPGRSRSSRRATSPPPIGRRGPARRPRRPRRRPWPPGRGPGRRRASPSGRARAGRRRPAAGRGPGPPCPRCGRSGHHRGGTPARRARCPTPGRSPADRRPPPPTGAARRAGRSRAGRLPWRSPRRGRTRRRSRRRQRSCRCSRAGARANSATSSASVSVGHRVRRVEAHPVDQTAEPVDDLGGHLGR